MRRCGRAAGERWGFTLVEVLILLVALAVLYSIVVNGIGPAMLHARVNRAASAVAGDLELAFTMAARQRQPVRLTTTGTTTYTISDRTGTVRAARSFGAGTEFKLDAVSFTPGTIDVFPSGIATAALTVAVTANGYTRQVTMSRGGQIRVMPL
jgi:type II secretory pathway pseudopilin PulG